MSKRYTKILELDKESEWYGEYRGSENYVESGNHLKTLFQMHLPDFIKLDKPTKIRMTISVVED